MKKFIMILFLCPSFMYSQADSLKDLLNYYPLQFGNYWEYKNVTQQMPYPPDSSAYSVEVKGDTLLDNNESYKVLLFKDIYPNNYIYYKYERIDSSNGCVYRYINDSSFTNNEFKIDSLFAQPGDTINSSREGFTSFGYFRTICNSIESDTLFVIQTQVKIYFDQSNIPEVEYRLAKGFGYYSSSSCEFSCGSTFMVYGRINGVEYGKRIITSAEEIKITPGSYQLFQNYPNPFNPNTKIIFEIPKAGNVTLRIYDLLGEVIEEKDLSFSSGGKYEIKFDGNNYSSGLLIYQMQYDGLVQTKKMLLLK